MKDVSWVHFSFNTVYYRQSRLHDSSSAAQCILLLCDYMTHTTLINSCLLDSAKPFHLMALRWKFCRSTAGYVTTRTLMRQKEAVHPWSSRFPALFLSLLLITWLRCFDILIDWTRLIQVTSSKRCRRTLNTARILDIWLPCCCSEGDRIKYSPLFSHFPSSNGRKVLLRAEQKCYLGLELVAFSAHCQVSPHSAK